MAVVDLKNRTRFGFLPSTARTADVTSDDFLVKGRGLIVVIDVTLDPASASVVFTVRGVDHVSGSTFNLLTSAAIAATGTTVLRITPDLTAAANLIAETLLPTTLRVFADHTDTDSITYSVSGMLTD